MLSRIASPAAQGVESKLIEIECDMSNGLPAMVVVGLPDKAIEEARERVRGAIKNSGLLLPPKRITLNLAPADLPKDGTAHDLGLALAILSASGQIAETPQAVFAGELALDGSLRPIRGVIGHANLAKAIRVPSLFVPSANAAEATLVPGIDVYPVDNLRQLYRHLIGEEPIKPFNRDAIINNDVIITTDFSEIYGQYQAKRAVEIAAAGGHNILLTGPPGTGKTMLAKAMHGILPAPISQEVVEITALHSLTGHEGVISQRPFRNPHHTSSAVALIGGGRIPKPGEVSLSHRGVLFLDELPEFPRSVLEALRQPLEEGLVTVSRASGQITFPARCQLVAASNPCPCGYAGDNEQSCNCSPSQITTYSRRISGPLLDRIDLVVPVARVERQALLDGRSAEPSNLIAARVNQARAIQTRRYGETATVTNADLTNEQIRRFCRLNTEAANVAQHALSSLRLSARAYLRMLKVARTIADLASADAISAEHIAEALQYRPTA